MAVEKVRGALRLAAADRRGHGLGLAAGLTLADARARIPDLVAVEAEPAADAAFLARLAMACERFTPLVELNAPDGLTLDITGCAHLFGGEAALRDRAAAMLAGLGLAARSGIAGTPDAARALARFSPAIARPGTEEALARPLPVQALGMEAETTLALTRAGLKTLGDLVDRPSKVLSARFGEELPVRLRRVLGREDRRIVPLRPLPDCCVERRFAEPILHAEAVEAHLARLVAKAARLMEQRGEGGRAFEASLFRTDGAVRRIAVETARASREAAAIFRLFRERIDALADPLDPGFGFDAMRLAVLGCEPVAEAQPTFEGRAGEEQAVAEVVDRLAARFGRERVLRFVAEDTHHPEREARAVSALAPPLKDAAAWREPRPGDPPARPLQLFDPPQPIETLAEVPDGPPLRFRWRRVLHEIARAEGPERIAPEWWREASDEPTRDYYRVEDAEGRRFWVFRRGLYARDAEAPRWFLHGLFA